MNRKWILLFFALLAGGMLLITSSEQPQMPTLPPTGEPAHHSGHQEPHLPHPENLLDTVPFTPPPEDESPPQAIMGEDPPFTGITGQVIDATAGLPVAGAEVHPVLWTRSQEQRGTTNMGATGGTVTDGEGRFKVPAVQGTYTVRAFCGSEEPHKYGVSEPFPLHWEETREVEVRIGGGLLLQGAVRDETGEGMPGLDVAITPSFSNSDPVYLRQTNERGEFSVAGMAGPRSSVTVITRLEGKRVEPHGPLTQDTTIPFNFTVMEAISAQLVNEVVLDYGGSQIEEGITFSILVNGTQQADSRQLLNPLRPGDNVIATGGLQIPGGIVELELLHSELGILKTHLRERDGKLQGRGWEWRRGRTVTGQVAGTQGPLWVILLSSPDATGPRVRWAQVTETGHFTLENVPNQPLHAAVQSDKEFLRLGKGYTIPANSDNLFLEVQ